MLSVHEFLTENYDLIYNSGKCTEEQARYMLDCLLEMARADEREIRSRLRVLMAHLLKYEFQVEKQSKSWVLTIREQSRKLSEFMDDKNLIQKISVELPDVYKKALRDASDETGLSIHSFFKEIPDNWTLERLSDPDFIESFLRNNAYDPFIRKYLNLK